MSPEQYAQTPVRDLLEAAARGRVGIDQRLIRAVIGRGPSALDDVLRYAAEDHQDTLIDLEPELVALIRHFHDARGLEYLLALVEAQPLDIQEDVTEAICSFGAEALEPVLSLYDRLAEDERDEVRFLLAGLGVRDERVRDILLDDLARNPGDAAMNLDLYGDTAAVPALEEQFEKLKADDEQEDSELSAVSFAVQHLRKQRENEQAGVDMGEPQPDSFDILSEYPDEAEPDFDDLSDAELLTLLDDADAAVRARAAALFFDEELDDEVRAKLLALAQNDPDVDVRARAWESLAEAHADEQVGPALIAKLRDPAAPLTERAGALLGLYERLDDEAVRPVVSELYEQREVRGRVLEAMWRSLDRQYADFFVRNLDDEDPEIRRHAIRGVGYCGVASQLGKLERLFSDGELRPDALFAYALAMPGEVSSGRVPGMLKKVEQRANGLSEDEDMLVKMALDQRLMMNGQEPFFLPDEDGDGADDLGEDDPVEDLPSSGNGRRL